MPILNSLIDNRILRKILHWFVMFLFILTSLSLVVLFVGCARENTIGNGCESPLLFLFILDLILILIYRFLLKSKILFIAVILILLSILLYLFVVWVLYVVDFCPSIINLMPSPIGNSHSLSPTQEFFCIFTDEVW